MKSILLFSLFFLISFSSANAQIVGTDCFLQGQWLEIGIDKTGAFGTCGSPAGYHAHNCYCTTSCATSGVNMDATYDWGHDGWTTGSPCFMGSYTQPGAPVEGWSVEFNGTEVRNWALSICPSPTTGGIAGSITSYVRDAAGNKFGTFTGNATIGGVTLKIVQETRVDTLASSVVVTAKLYNLSTTTTANNVYYERMCDPDNTSYWAGGSATQNVIVHQNEDYRHDVMIASYDSNRSYSPPYIQFTRYNSYMALATKDCRAKCGIVPGLSPFNPPHDLWGGVGLGTDYSTGLPVTNVGDSDYQDQGIFLVYKIGTIPANDSAVVSYAYVFDRNEGIDDAFPDPTPRLNGGPVGGSDTFDMCTLPPGVDTIPIDLAFAEDKNWTWSKWVWSPATGLSATTGAHVVVTGSSLSGPTTYTITGTDSAVGMVSCHNRTLYVTILPCQATPLFYDSLRRGCLYDTVYFFNRSLNTIHWSWDYGDGSPHDTGYIADSTSWNTVHVYPAHSQYTATLLAGNFRGDFTLSKSVDLRQDVHAGFSALPDTLCFEPGVTMHFLNTSTADTGDFYGGSGLVPYTPSRYLWNFQDTGISTLSDPDYAFSRPGLFKVKLVAWDAMSCPDTVINKVFIVQNTLKMVDDTAFCYAVPTPLYNVVTTVPFTPDANAFAYSWSETPVPHLDNTTVQFPKVITTGFFKDYFTVTIPGIGPDGCPVSDSINISSYVPKRIQNMTATVTIPFGNSIQLNAGNMVLYYWRPNDGSLNDPNISNPIATPTQSTIYMVHGLDDHGCPDSAIVNVIVDTSMTQQIPSAFTPNGDGINDVFRPVGIQFQRLLEFRVYNRWGQEIFYTNNREVGWDGTFHGDKLDAGVYSYLIVVARPGQENVVYKGNVTLLR